MAAQQDLVLRVRQALQDRHPREVSMFGGVSFMIDGRMVVAARRDGTLLLRVDPASAAGLLTRAGAQPAHMGAGRPMGNGWISIDPAALRGSRLNTWLVPALSFHANETSSDERSR